MAKVCIKCGRLSYTRELNCIQCGSTEFRTASFNLNLLNYIIVSILVNGLVLAFLLVDILFTNSYLIEWSFLGTTVFLVRGEIILIILGVLFFNSVFCFYILNNLRNGVKNPKSKNCIFCGKEIRLTSAFCKYCGKEL